MFYSCRTTERVRYRYSPSSGTPRGATIGLNLTTELSTLQSLPVITHRPLSTAYAAKLWTTIIAFPSIFFPKSSMNIQRRIYSKQKPMFSLDSFIDTDSSSLPEHHAKQKICSHVKLKSQQCLSLSSLMHIALQYLLTTPSASATYI